MSYTRTYLPGAGAALLVASIFTLFTSASFAQLPKLGGETLIHPVTTQYESEASVAMDAAGNYVIAYTNHDSTNAGVAVQRYFRNGTPNGSLIVPTATPLPEQDDASVAMANDGRFVVVWEDNARGGNNHDVRYALYSAAGVQVASGIVNTTVTGVRENARVAMNRVSGEFVVVFAGGISQTAVDVYIRAYTAAGAAVAPEQKVNTGGNLQTDVPSVAIASNGNIIVAWDTDAVGDANWEVMFQRFTFPTTVVGTNTQASLVGSDVTNVDVACDDAGNFVLAWVDGLPMSQTDPKNLLYRRYNALGTPATAQPQIMRTGAYTNNGDTQIPRIRLAVTAQGFAAVYLHNDEIYARFFGADGSLLGSEIQVNTTSNSNSGEYQTDPWIALNPNGNRATVVWTGTGAQDNGGVHKQRFAAVNTAPTLTNPGARTAPELQPYTFTATAAESPSNFGDIITFSLTNTVPTGASINSTTGVFSWTPTEAQGPGVYPVTIRATDNGEPPLFSEETFNITVTEVNQAPTNLALSNNTVVHAAPAGTTVGTLSAADLDLPVQTMTYSLVAGTGDTDNAMFAISGNLLQVATPPDRVAKPTLSVRLQANDVAGGTVQQQFTISVVPPASVDEWMMY